MGKKRENGGERRREQPKRANENGEKRSEMKKTLKVNALSAGNEQELICLVISAKAIIYFSKIRYIADWRPIWAPALCSNTRSEALCGHTSTR